MATVKSLIISLTQRIRTEILSMLFPLSAGSRTFADSERRNSSFCGSLWDGYHGYSDCVIAFKIFIQ